MQIKRATINDINTLVKLWLDFLAMDRGKLSTEDEDAIRKQLQEYLPKHLKSGNFIATIAWLDEKPISAAFLVINERPANPSFLTGITIL